MVLLKDALTLIINYVHRFKNPLLISSTTVRCCPSRNVFRSMADICIYQLGR